MPPRGPQPHSTLCSPSTLPACLHACTTGINMWSRLGFQLQLPSLPPSAAMSHIAVERNRRRQMNEHLKVLRTLTPSFYIKRGDQASIIGGAIEFIKELQQVLHSLEAKKKRKSLSPSPTPSPRPLLQLTPSPTSSSPDMVKELGACCNSPVADVEAKLSGSNVLLRTLSKRIPGQVVKIITVLERQAFEILHLNISSMEDTVLYSFVIKIGLECQLSVEELALEVQRSFCEEIGYPRSLGE